MEHQMYGMNFEVAFGVTSFEYCTTLEEVRLRIKGAYPNASPEDVELTEVDAAECLSSIRERLAYRGDAAAGLVLTSQQETKLAIEHDQYIDFIQQFIGPDTVIYAYGDETGLPCYPVFWFYSFILVNTDRPSLFFFGAASD